MKGCTIIVALVFFFVVFALSEVSAVSPPEDGWSAWVAPVADVWSSRMGYNVRSRHAAEPAEVEVEDDDEGDDHMYADMTTRTMDRRGPNGGGPCDNSTEVVCNGRGECLNGTCLCDDGWAGLTCHHERKEKLTAFLLEFFVGALTGAGSFYLGYIGQGVGKLVLYWGGCLLLCCGNVGAAFSKKCCGEVGRAIAYVVVNLVATAMITGVAIWCFVDWILILTDNLDDYDGYYLNGF